MVIRIFYRLTTRELSLLDDALHAESLEQNVRPLIISFPLKKNCAVNNETPEWVEVPASLDPDFAKPDAMLPGSTVGAWVRPESGS